MAGDTAAVFDRLRLPIKWVGERKYRPQRQHEGDAGFDLLVAGDWTIKPGEFVDIPSGVEQVELPAGVWALITGRSSTLRKRGLLVAQGIIDHGYRGPLFCGVQNLGSDDVEVKDGERLAQLIPMPLTAAGLIVCQVDERKIESSDRGTNGFGSTGS